VKQIKIDMTGAGPTMLVIVTDKGRLVVYVIPGEPPSTFFKKEKA